MPLPRVGVVCDLIEERWPSMDLVADMLLHQLQRNHSDAIDATRICPPMRRRFTGQRSEARGRGAVGSGQWAVSSRQRSDLSTKLFNADRVLNRFWDYPRFVRDLKSEFDLFHLVDHSYSQLLHELPAGRTVVNCHDLDTFQCLLHPEQEPRSIFFRKMVERSLSGFRKAALVTCDSNATRDELLAHKLIAPECAVVISNGVHPSCSPAADPLADEEAKRLLGQASDDAPDILHVGSTIPRKRIDLLLRIFAAVRKEFQRARLIRVGGPYTFEQMKLVDELGIADAIVVLPHLERNVLAGVYRRAAVVLQPSEREGFGLPVVEAMACGTAVVASDLAVLREVGGEAAIYCNLRNVEKWTDTVAELLTERHQQPERWAQRREAGLAQAAKFTWAEHARKMVAVYQSLLS